MGKENLKKEKKKNLQQKFEELKFGKEQLDFQKFMRLHEEINSYSQENENQILIELDNSTKIINS